MATYFAAGFVSSGGIFHAPTADGTDGQAIVTDGSGNLSFSTVGASSPLTLTASATSETPLTIEAISGQTANVQEWYDGSGALVSFVSPTGMVAVTGSAKHIRATNGSDSYVQLESPDGTHTGRLRFRNSGVKNIDVEMVSNALVIRGNTSMDGNSLSNVGNPFDVGTATAVVRSTVSNDTPVIHGRQPGISNAYKMAVQVFGGNFGVGTDSPASKLTVASGDAEVTGSANGLILESPDGTRWRVTVDDTGTLNTAAA